jgi:hypothetical protein
MQRLILLRIWWSRKVSEVHDQRICTSTSAPSHSHTVQYSFRDEGTHRQPLAPNLEQSTARQRQPL